MGPAPVPPWLWQALSWARWALPLGLQQGASIPALLPARLPWLTPCCVPGGDSVGRPRCPAAADRHGRGSPAALAPQHDPGVCTACSGCRRQQSGRRGQRGDAGNRNHNCSVRSLMVKVRDLGLGFDSDEIVRFKYCSGSCRRSRSNYDLTLATLLQEKAITPGPPGHVASHPCCRPSRYEAVSFMNVQNSWQTVEKVSAAECKCVG
uniref:Artemin n=1 Tax=Pelusios castaneus TaxID=367368 RepID=A0A8C8RZM2_9SAUR